MSGCPKCRASYPDFGYSATQIPTEKGTFNYLSCNKCGYKKREKVCDCKTFVIHKPCKKHRSQTPASGKGEKKKDGK